MIEILTQPETYIALLTLTFLEVVLGIDNIIFISIVTNKLPKEKQDATRTLGLALAMIFRIGLLLAITWIIKLKQPLFSIMEHSFSVRDVILFSGGIFLIAKSVSEIHHKIEGMEKGEEKKAKSTVLSTIIQIILLDLVFSFDSILTAIGLTDKIPIMIIAIVIAIFIMMYFAAKISSFINRHPTLQVLALSFLILIGFMLAIEAFHYEIPKGYIYFAVFFSFAVELINMKVRKTIRANHNKKISVK